MQGKWESKSNPGIVVAEIKNKYLEWPNGDTIPYDVDGSTIHISIDGVKFQGQYDGVNISWSDGDIWKKLLVNEVNCCFNHPVHLLQS